MYSYNVKVALAMIAVLSGILAGTITVIATDSMVGGFIVTALATWLTCNVVYVVWTFIKQRDFRMDELIKAIIDHR